MWFDESVMYQVYPLTYFGAPEINDGKQAHRILKFIQHIPHLKKLGINMVYFCPIFESSMHGYDTKDFRVIDKRLGTNEDFKKVCEELHKNGIKVILDGVFHHVGRDFFAFRDVVEKKWESPYKDWFFVNFDGNSNYNDGLYYEGWEGHYELVKINLENWDLKNYLFGSIEMWINEFGIDGLRLDVAYLLNHNFIRDLRAFCDSKKQDFFLVGEMIHGDYNSIVNGEMLHSATNYECFKGIHSSFNSMNMFEIAHSLNRQFGKEQWCLYRGKNLISFADNHDVSRLASVLQNKNHLRLAYGLMMAMPGIPCIYYGSEWGEEGVKVYGTDASLRPYVEVPVFNELSEFISVLCKIRTENKVLCYGDYENVLVTNHQLVFKREFEGKRLFVLINAADYEHTYNFGYSLGECTELISNQKLNIEGEVKLPPYSVQYLFV